MYIYMIYIYMYIYTSRYISYIAPGPFKRLGPGPLIAPLGHSRA